MRKIILNLAISLDWYICTSDGKFDWIKGDGNKSNDTKSQFDFSGFLKEVDTIVMWKKAYIDCWIEDIENHENKTFYIASSNKIDTKYSNIEIINWNITDKILQLKEKKWKNIWLFWWAWLTDEFIKENIIDEYIIWIIPILLWEWRRLFLGDNPLINLHLKENTTQDWIVILRYIK